jgi:hypothetical protein
MHLNQEQLPWALPSRPPPPDPHLRASGLVVPSEAGCSRPGTFPFHPPIRCNPPAWLLPRPTADSSARRFPYHQCALPWCCHAAAQLRGRGHGGRPRVRPGDREKIARSTTAEEYTAPPSSASAKPGKQHQTAASTATTSVAVGRALEPDARWGIWRGESSCGMQRP